jgi:D-aminopeptidase
VKEGIDNYACISLSADAARRLIRERAAAALKPGAEIIDARTIRFHGKDFFEAWQ